MLQVDNLSPSATLTCAARTAPGASASALSAYGSQNRGVNSRPLPPPSLLPRPNPSLQEQCPQVQRGRGTSNVLVHWTQNGPRLQSAVGNETDDDDDDDDDDDTRAFTPPPPRGRLSYTRYQLELLNGIYREVRYPNTVQKQLIAKRVGITREQVKIWFQNRRRKDVVGHRGSLKDGAIKGDQNASCSQVDRPSAVRDTITTSDSNSPPTVRSDDDGSPAVASSFSSDTCAGGKGGKAGSSDCDLGGASIDKTMTRMVPEVVMRSVISELGRFSSDKLKSKKDKLKTRQKHQRARSRSASSSSGGGGGATSMGGVGLSGARPAPAANLGCAGAGGAQARSTSLARLFCPYDMVAPPNKVTPTAFLNTSANRFHHSRNTSAFSSPREVRTDGLVVLGNNVACLTGLEGLGAGMSQTVGGGVPADPNHHHYPALSGMGVGGVGLMAVSQTPSGGVHEGLPLLSDFLGPPHRHPLDAGVLSREPRDSSQPAPAAEETGENRMSSMGGAPHGGSFGTQSSSLTMNRVFPFPLFADPPIVLSNLSQYEALRGHSSWPPVPTTHLNAMSTLSGRDESYKPVMISSITNPFFAHSSPASHWPLQHTAPESSSQGSYAQL